MEDLTANTSSPTEKISNEGLHPILGSMIGREVISIEQQSLDSPEELRQLELNYEAADFIQRWYSPEGLSPIDEALGPLSNSRHYVDRINNQFLKKVIPSILNPDLKSALESFRSIIPNTVDEEMVLLVNDEQFGHLHNQLKTHMSEIDEIVEDRISENSLEIARADRM